MFSWHRFALPCTLAIFATVCWYSEASADPSIRERAVDVILLHDGTRLLGSVLQSDDAETDLLLRRTWLQDHQPHILDASPLLTAPSASHHQAAKQLREHLAGRHTTVPRELERTGFLNEQIRRIESSPQKYPALVILTIPVKRIRRQFLQPKQRRRIGFAAVLNQLMDAESSSFSNIQNALRALPSDDIITEIPPVDRASLAISDRILLHADKIFGRNVRLIQFGDSWFVDGEDRQDFQQIAAEIMRTALQSQVRMLLQETSGIPESPSINAVPSAEPAIVKLEPEGVKRLPAAAPDIVEVTRLSIHSGGLAATVTLDMFRQRATAWERVCRVSATAKSADITNDQKIRIRNDPQISAALDLVASTGLAAATNTAVISGAVVELAKRRASDRLQEFLNVAADSANGLTVERRMLDFDEP